MLWRADALALRGWSCSRGVDGNWYEAERKECHLSEERVCRVMSHVIETHKEKHGEAPTNCYSRPCVIHESEWKAFNLPSEGNATLWNTH